MPYLPLLYTELQVLEWIKDVVLRNSLVMLAVDDRRDAAASPPFRAAFSSTFTSRRGCRARMALDLLAAAKEEARAVCACMSSNEIYPLVGSTSNAD